MQPSSNALQTRIITATFLGLGVLAIGLINNFWLIWLVLGAVYMLAFHEATRLFGINNNSLYAYAAILWIIASIYPYSEDLLVISGLIFVGAVAYTQNIPFRNFLPFLYPTAGMLYVLSLYQEYGISALLWLVVVVASADIGAYFVGKSIGRPGSGHRFGLDEAHHRSRRFQRSFGVVGDAQLEQQVGEPHHPQPHLAVALDHGVDFSQGIAGHVDGVVEKVDRVVDDAAQLVVIDGRLVGGTVQVGLSVSRAMREASLICPFSAIS